MTNLQAQFLGGCILTGAGAICMAMHWPPKLGFMVLAVVGAALAAGGLIAMSTGKRGPTESGRE